MLAEKDMKAFEMTRMEIAPSSFQVILVCSQQHLYSARGHSYNICEDGRDSGELKFL